MRKTIWKAAAAVFMGVAVFATSCTEKEELKPNFPEMQNHVKEAGETVELTIAPNMAWELSLSAANNLFWFEEAGVNRSTLSGAAGETTVTIHITDEKPLGTDYNCEVTMTMGGESKVIAAIMVAGDTPSFKVYPAIWDAEANDWTYAANGYDYEYANEPATSVSLKFDSGSMAFVCPAKVVANYAWSVPTSADAEWFTPVAEKEAGTTEVIFQGKADALPEGGAENISINVQRRGQEAAETTFTASIDDYRSVFISGRLESGETIAFGKEGNAATYDDENPYMVYTSEATKYELYAYDETDGVYNPMPTMINGGWVIAESSLSDETTDILAYYDLKFFVQENEEKTPRTAVVIVRTGDKENEPCFTDNDSRIAEGFTYFIIEQEGTVASLKGPLSEIVGGAESLTKMSFTALSTADAPYLYSDFNCEYAYRLISADMYTSIQFANVPANYSYEVWSFDGIGTTAPKSGSWWVKYWAPEGEEPLTIKLDPVTGNGFWTGDSDDDPYAENLGEGSGFDFSLMGLRYVYENSYLVIKDGEAVVAVVECKFDNKATFGSAELFSLIQNDLGATLEVKPLTDLPGESGDIIMGNVYGVSEGYLLTAEYTGSVVIKTPSNEYFALTAENETWYSVEPTGDCELTISFAEGSGVAVLQFNNEMTMPIAALVISKL